jgi:integrase
VKLKLDASVIGRELAANLTEEFIWDADLEGFGLRLRRRRNGELQRTFVAQYRNDGRTRRVTLGSARKLTLAQAREAARKILARATLGSDPQSERAAKRLRAARTFHTTVEAYLAGRADALRPSSLRVAKLYLTGSYFRPLHAVGIADVSPADVAASLTTVAHQRSAQTAAAARRSVSALFRWAMEESWITTNPVISTRRPARPRSRDRVLNDAELTAVLRAADDSGEFGTVVKLLVLLGSRRQEVGSMAWSELDLVAGTWTLPGERSKNHRSHTIAVPPTGLAILRAIPHTGRDALFGETANGFVSWGREKRAFDQRLPDFVRPFRLHDLRRSVATGMANIGIEPHVIELVLNHAAHRSGVSGTYNHSRYEPAVRNALARWDQHVTDLLEGRAEKVIALRAS